MKNETKIFTERREFDLTSFALGHKAHVDFIKSGKEMAIHNPFAIDSNAYHNWYDGFKAAKRGTVIKYNKRSTVIIF